MNKISSKDWQVKTLGEVCEQIFAGGDVPKNNFSKIKTEDFTIPIYANGEKKLGLYGYTNISKVVSPALTISGRGTIGFSVVRKLPFFPIVRLLVLIPNSETDVQFLKYSIDNSNIKHTGSSIPQLTVPTVKSIKIPIPNIKTQQAIVSKIEELFSELDKGVEDLKTAQQQLKTYRQSVLKWAFEGKLTNDNVKDGELPAGWETLKIKDICEIKGGKNQSKVINPNGKYPIYGSSGIFGYADEYICDENTTIVGRKGNINSPLFVTTKFWNVDTAFGLCVNEKYDSKLLFYFCLGFNFKNLDKSTTIPSLAKTDIQSIDIQVPPLEEHHRIVQEIESRLSVADKMEESITESLQQAEALRQSILKKAFSGELV